MSICGFCKCSSNYHEGLKGKTYGQTKLMFIAHRPDQRVNIEVLPSFDSYEIALSETKTGKNIGTLLKHCNLSLDNIFWTNLFKCVLLENRPPNKEEYLFCVNNHLNLQIEEANPNLIVGLGSQVYKILFPDLVKEKKFEQRIGDIVKYNQRNVLIFPHPQKISPPYCNLEKKKELFDLMKTTLEKFL